MDVKYVPGMYEFLGGRGNPESVDDCEGNWWRWWGNRSEGKTGIRVNNILE